MHGHFLQRELCARESALALKTMRRPIRLSHVHTRDYSRRIPRQIVVNVPATDGEIGDYSRQCRQGFRRRFPVDLKRVKFALTTIPRLRPIKSCFSSQCNSLVLLLFYDAASVSSSTILPAIIMRTYQAQMANFIHGFTCIYGCNAIFPNPKPGFDKKAPGLESIVDTTRKQADIVPQRLTKQPRAW